MKKYLTTFPIATGKKKRLITTYRADECGQELRTKHIQDLATLEQNYPLNYDFTFAYLKEQSIKQLVNKHLGNKYFYQFDLANFFGSIDHQLLLGKLNATDQHFNQSLIAECSNNKTVGLALGLVPSPYLSNIYLTNFDLKLVSILNRLDSSIVYTRYSDDLTISSNISLDEEELTRILSEQLAVDKLALNPTKTRSSELTAKGGHIKILGLNIVRGEHTNYITVGRKFKRDAHYEQSPLRKQAMESYINYNEH